MTDEQIWKFLGNVLVVGSPTFFVVAIVYMILRDLLRKETEHEHETETETDIDNSDANRPVDRLW